MKPPTKTKNKFRRFKPGRKSLSNLVEQLEVANLVLKAYYELTKPFVNALFDKRFNRRGTL